MSFSINSVGSGSSVGVDPSKMASSIASKMMADLNPNNTGTVTKDQFVLALTAKGVSSADATKMYESIDTKNTGSITKSDIETAIKDGSLKPPSGASQGAAKGSGSSNGSGSAGGASKTNSSKSYDKMDLNQDGTVTAVEAMIYELKHINLSSSAKTTSTQQAGSNVNVKV